MHMLKPPSSSLYVASFYTCILSQFWQTYPDAWSAYMMSAFITIWLTFLLQVVFISLTMSTPCITSNILRSGTTSVNMQVRLSFKWDLGRQCRPRSDAAERSSDQGLLNENIKYT